MDLDTITNTLIFIKRVADKDIEIDYANFKSVCRLSFEYSLRYDKLEKRLPYHINIIDELRADENAHSRILRGLFKHKSNGEYETLKNFIRNLLTNFNIVVETQIVTAEKYRIDLLVQERGKYAIIFENKINKALFQQNQFARYINKLKESYDEKDIFVVYLPPNHYTKIEDHCWENPDDGYKSYKQSFEKRFETLTFRDNILPWLENKLLPSCKVEDIYVQSTIIQYIDHLKGKFDLREINKNMNMELQDYLKEELKFENRPDLDYDKVNDKLTEINKVTNQLQNLKNAQLLECWEYWFDKLKEDFKNYKYVFFPKDKHPKIGVVLKINGLEFSILIEYNGLIYYGLKKNIVDDPAYPKVQKELQPIIDSIGGFQLSDNWHGWKYTSFKDAYKQLSHLIKESEKQINSTHRANQL